MRASVVIPAHNEAGNIAALVQETYAVVPAHHLAEVIVVDDGSDDGTGAEVKALIGTLPGLRYLRHANRCGQSTALRTGSILLAFGYGQRDRQEVADVKRHCFDQDALVPLQPVELAREAVQPFAHGRLTLVGSIR